MYMFFYFPVCLFEIWHSFSFSCSAGGYTPLGPFSTPVSDWDLFLKVSPGLSKSYG